MRLTSFFALVLLAAAAVPGAPAQQVVELDPTSTTIRFELGATMHTVHGTASLDHGRVAFDLETGGVEGEIVVNAQSADTDNKKRDKKMHAQVLESEKYPRIVLKPVRITGALPASGEAPLTVEADLEIHGEIHRISLPAKVTFKNGGAIALSAQFDVPYVEWGLDDPSSFVLRVKKTVNVSVEAQGRLVGPE